MNKNIEERKAKIEALKNELKAEEDAMLSAMRGAMPPNTKVYIKASLAKHFGADAAVVTYDDAFGGKHSTTLRLEDLPIVNDFVPRAEYDALKAKYDEHLRLFANDIASGELVQKAEVERRLAKATGEAERPLVYVIYNRVSEHYEPTAYWDKTSAQSHCSYNDELVPLYIHPAPGEEFVYSANSNNERPFTMGVCACYRCGGAVKTGSECECYKTALTGVQTETQELNNKEDETVEYWVKQLPKILTSDGIPLTELPNRAKKAICIALQMGISLDSVELSVAPNGIKDELMQKADAWGDAKADRAKFECEHPSIDPDDSELINAEAEFRDTLDKVMTLRDASSWARIWVGRVNEKEGVPLTKSVNNCMDLAAAFIENALSLQNANTDKESK